MTMKVLDNLKELITGTSAAISSLKRADGGLRAALDELAREEGELLSRPSPPAAVEQNLAKLIADLGQRWRDAHGLAIVLAGSGSVRRDMGPASRRQPDQLVAPTLAPVFAAPVTVELLSALAPEMVLAGLRRVVEGTRYEAGPALPDRLARLAAIERERGLLEQQHADLVDEAEAAGVHLEHTEAEAGRRAQKAAARKRWEDDVAQNSVYYQHHPEARPPEPAA